MELLDQHRPLVQDLKQLAASLGLELGWHYLLDLTWIITGLRQHLGTLQGKSIMDAGAGTGILQWYLAQQGAQVVSVDRLSRAALPLRFRKRFRVEGLRPADLLPADQTIRANLSQRGWALPALASQAKDWLSSQQPTAPVSGQVILYNQDLAHLSDLADQSLDAVVAVSSLEHNTPEGLQQVVAEIHGVLKPGGALLASLVAARDQDTWHAPSSAWCYTDASLRRIFGLPANAPSNYEDYDKLFAALRDCAELRENLASFYFKSDQNGMPWGKWDPQYQPVGVYKTL
ncbi:MAG: class I SAM-dependent methyltransferase [Chloroflexota bacterium]